MSEKIVSNTYVTIAARDGRVLEVADFSHDSGALVQLWADAGEDSQRWVAVEVAEGLYKLENKLTGKVLDVIASGADNGAWVHQGVGLPGQGQSAVGAGARRQRAV